MASALGMQQTLNEGAVIRAEIVKQGAWLGAGSRRGGDRVGEVRGSRTWCGAAHRCLCTAVSTNAVVTHFKNRPAFLKIVKTV